MLVGACVRVCRAEFFTHGRGVGRVGKEGDSLGGGVLGALGFYLLVKEQKQKTNVLMSCALNERLENSCACCCQHYCETCKIKPVIFYSS